jgi:hypothetical protein
MKLLYITPEIEQAMVQIMDAALKSGGMSVINSIDKIRNAIQSKYDPPKSVDELKE